MKKTFIIFFLVTVTFIANGQATNYDSLKHLADNAKDDLTKFARVTDLGMSYLWSYPDSSLIYLQQGILLARQMKSDRLLITAYIDYAWFYILIGDYPQALHYAQESLTLAKKIGDFLYTALAYDVMIPVYIDEGDYERALSSAKMAKSVMESHWRPSFAKTKNTDTVSEYVIILNGVAPAYEKANQLDSALKYIQIVDETYEKFSGRRWSAASYELGNIYLKKEDYQTAIKHYRDGIALAANIDNKKDLMDNYNGMAVTFKKTGEVDSSISYAHKVLDESKFAHYPIAKLDALSVLSDIYKSKNNIDSLAKYLALTIATKDSLFGMQKVFQIQAMTFNEQLRQQEEAQRQEEFQTRVKLYSSLAALFVFFIIAFLLYRNNRHKQKAYALLQKQKQQIDIQKSKAERTLEELKNTQSQLVQSEKMASLGELTAGIAHEIQNPLNFVNNFSDVSNELLEEMKTELEKGNTKEVIAIVDDVKQNLEKILHHGKRADAIVKGMLQHSRTGSSQKELTDINALADEYLRLAYHGLRAKDKSFNANFETDLDKSVGKINIVPQDIGRAVLNLITNAFYVVAEKKKQLPEGYEPTVTVTTKKEGNKVFVSVKDNGKGIPQKVLEKIFQPFFTTKPTGQGTGLGLSLAYDIVKAHGGEIKVETKEGEGSEFVIQLPIV